MFGAPGDARRALRRLLVRWHALAALLAAIAIGSVVYAIVLARPPTIAEPKRPVPAERPF